MIERFSEVSFAEREVLGLVEKTGVGLQPGVEDQVDVVVGLEMVGRKIRKISLQDVVVKGESTGKWRAPMSQNTTHWIINL